MCLKQAKSKYTDIKILKGVYWDATFSVADDGTLDFERFINFPSFWMFSSQNS